MFQNSTGCDHSVIVTEFLVTLAMFQCHNSIKQSQSAKLYSFISKKKFDSGPGQTLYYYYFPHQTSKLFATKHGMYILGINLLHCTHSADPSIVVTFT